MLISNAWNRRCVALVLGSDGRLAIMNGFYLIADSDMAVIDSRLVLPSD